MCPHGGAPPWSNVMPCLTLLSLSLNLSLFDSRAHAHTTPNIHQMALENFVEMREKVGDVKFNFLKSVENILENTFPDQFRSRYAMVCYGGGGGITYDAALKLGEVQWEILEELYVGLKVRIVYGWCFRV